MGPVDTVIDIRFDQIVLSPDSARAVRRRRRGITRFEVFVAIAVLGLAAWLLIPALSASRVAGQRQRCLANLTSIGRALDAYLKSSDQRWPYAAKLRSTQNTSGKGWPLLPAVLAPHLGDDPHAFRCPGDVRELEDDDPLRKEFSSSTTWHETEGSSYEWWWGELRAGHRVGEEPLTKAAGMGQGRADQWLLTDFQPFHEGDGGGAINTLFADLQARTSRPRRPQLE